MNNFARISFSVAIILVLLFPVSNQFNTLNESMIRNCFVLNLILLFLILLYEAKINKIQIIISILIILDLIISTLLFAFTYHDPDSIKISYGYFFQYLSFCLLINIFPVKLALARNLDKLFLIVCVLIISVGVLTFFHSPFIELFLKTYYINHYPHVYISMFTSYKTVTFFATHSIACYIYFIIWWLLDYRRKVKKGILNYALLFGILFNIVMCLSVSSLLCIGLITVYYYVGWIKISYRNNILKAIIFIFLSIIALFLCGNNVQQILSSDVNGLLGRFGSSGNLKAPLDFAISNFIPLGICDLSFLWLTDGGYFIHFIRGGVLLVFLIYYGLFRFIVKNVNNKGRATMLIISLFAFEVGYQFSICMRFFMIMLFAVIYYKSLEKQDNN